MLDENAEKKVIKDIENSLDLLLKHLLSLKKDQEVEFSKLRRNSLRDKKPYIASGSFYNFKQTEKKLNMITNARYLLDAFKKVTYVK